MLVATFVIGRTFLNSGQRRLPPIGTSGEPFTWRSDSAWILQAAPAVPRLLPSHYRSAVLRTPDAESLHQLHLSVLQGDSTAATSLTARLMLTVRGLLGQRLRRVDSAIIDEGIEDAILDYLLRPATYQVEKANLLTFIALAAARNVFDALRRDKRRRAIEAQAATELARPWTSVTDIETKRSDAFDLFAGAQTEEERRFLEAKLAGERRADVLAQLLNTSQLAPDEQRQLVKQTMERLRMRWSRLASRT